MKKLTMAIVTMIMVMIMALSANAEGTEFVGAKFGQLMQHLQAMVLIPLW